MLKNLFNGGYSLIHTMQKPVLVGAAPQTPNEINGESKILSSVKEVYITYMNGFRCRNVNWNNEELYYLHICEYIL